MTELERALLHIKTRADAWAVKEVEKAIDLDYKTAFQIACALLNGDTLYGMDAESIFLEIMKKDGCVCSFDYEDYILTHLNELRDDKALSQEPCDDVVSRQAVIYYIKGHIHEIITESGTDKNAHTNSILKALINGVETMPAVNPQPCDDAISRDAVYQLLMNMASSAYGFEEIRRIVDDLPPVTQKPIECDAIRREDAINIASLHCLTIDETVKALEQLPSVNPQPLEHFIEGVHAMGYREGYKDAQKQKYGKWIKQTLSVKPFGEDTVLCDQCAFMTDKDSMYNYCPNCGCRMVEPQESEDKE